MKKLIILTIMFLILPLKLNASSIKEITMDITIDEYGNASIIENWNVNITDGTEGYKPYYNLGESQIRNFTVKDQDRDYTYTENWNNLSSLSDKAYKNTLLLLDDGVEIVWGISKYGNRNYTLSYEITNFVKELEDSQIIYWTLIPHNLSLKPDDVKIKIKTPTYLDEKTPVWGYGNYGGYAYVYDGIIEMQSDGYLASYEYMTLLVKFDKETFTLSEKLSKTFEDIHNMAEEGAEEYVPDENSYFSFENPFSIIVRIIPILVTSGFITLAISSVTNKGFKKPISKGKFPKDLKYYRDIPCNKNIFYGYFLASNYNLNKQDTDLLGAVILKWVKQKYVTVESREVKKVFKTKEETIMIMHKEKAELSGLEKTMFDYMYSASKDGILESNEFKKYSEKNYNKILKWFDDVLKEEREKKTNELLLVKEGKTYKETQKIYEEATKLAGLKKFLEEFSSIEDKSTIEVHLWEEYLMFAQIFGIAEKVAKELKKIYPDVITDVDYQSAMYIHTFSTMTTNSLTTAKQRATNYTSGGGGFSSGGGGGGSFGGGGGGGGFR